jgi:hypothetical protein
MAALAASSYERLDVLVPGGLARARRAGASIVCGSVIAAATDRKHSEHTQSAQRGRFQATDLAMFGRARQLFRRDNAGHGPDRQLARYRPSKSRAFEPLFT